MSLYPVLCKYNIHGHVPVRRYRDPAAAHVAAAHGGGGGRLGVQAPPAHPRTHGQVHRAAGAAPQGTAQVPNYAIYLLDINDFSLKEDEIDEWQLQLQCTVWLRSLSTTVYE